MTEEKPIPEKPISAPRKKLGWFSKIILGLNWFAIAGLFLACISPYVSPAVFWPLAFFGLVHPVFVIVNFIFLLLWTIRRRKQAFYTLAVLLFNIPWCRDQFRFFHSSANRSDKGITVMSYNVKLFDLYNWTGNSKTRAKMFTLIANEKPDILSLQEFYNTDYGNYKNLDSLKKLLNLPYVHVEYTITLRKDDHWGIVTFSKYPIINSGQIVFNTRNNNRCIYSDLQIGNDTVRVYNMHLQSVSLGYADLKTLDQLGAGEDFDDQVESSKNILRRMKRAYEKRAHQAESIAKHISECPYKVIVCGDFNDTPVSYSYRIISNGLTDSFLESGSGLGKSLDTPFPFPRIDYIFHGPSMNAWEFKTIQQDGMSDHYPIIRKITLNTAY